jgi:anti-repressor protein
MGYKNPAKALRDHVDEDDKGVTKCSTLGGNQKMTVINESGLYALILSSKLKEAKSYSHTYPSKKITAEEFSGGCLYPPPLGG